MNNKVRFELCDNFIWEIYEEQVYKDIVNRDNKVEIIWDLVGITKLPSFTVILKQINLMKRIKKHIEKNIKKNIIIVNSLNTKEFLLWLFKYIYTPINETVVIVN